MIGEKLDFLKSQRWNRVISLNIMICTKISPWKLVSLLAYFASFQKKKLISLLAKLASLLADKVYPRSCQTVKGKISSQNVTPDCVEKYVVSSR